MRDQRSPIQHALVLHRIDPDRRAARFYSLMIERTIDLDRPTGTVAGAAACRLTGARGTAKRPRDGITIG